MILVALFIGAILVVAAIRNSQGALFTALYNDVPAFVVWAAAIFAIGAVGFIPGLKPVSRGLLALVILVIVLNNYQNIIKGFQDAWQNPTKAGTTANSGSNSSSGTAPTSSQTGFWEGLYNNSIIPSLIAGGQQKAESFGLYPNG